MRQLYKTYIISLNDLYRRDPPRQLERTYNFKATVYGLQHRPEDVNKMPIEAYIYPLEGLTMCSVEELRKPFAMMLQKERVTQLIIIVLIGGDSLSTLVNIKAIVKLSNNSYHYLCTSGAFNVPTASFNPCFNCDSTDHGIVSFPHKKQIQGRNGGGKT